MKLKMCETVEIPSSHQIQQGTKLNFQRLWPKIRVAANLEDKELWTTKDITWGMLQKVEHTVILCDHNH